MLNDFTRNSSFKRALTALLRTPGRSVLDIGSGTGILRSVNFLLILIFTTNKVYTAGWRELSSLRFIPVVESCLLFVCNVSSFICSMMAVQAGGSQVFACDDNENLLGLSHQVLVSNEMGDKVKLLSMNSKDIVVGRDIPHRVDLVVTETVDCGELIPLVLFMRR